MPEEHDDRRVAVFIDADNILIGAQGAGFSRPVAALMERVRENWFVMSARAYGDWTKHPCRSFLREFQMNTVEMTQLPTSAVGKNTADINLAVDAMEMTLSNSSPDIVVLAAADRDFVPLVQKLRRYGKEVIGIGVKGSVSSELEQACNAFMMLDDIILEAAPEPSAEFPAVPETPEGAEAEKPDLSGAFRLLTTAMEDVRGSERDVVGSIVLERLKELKEGFSHASYGFESFRDFVLAAQARKLLQVTLSSTGDLRLAPYPYIEERDEPEVELNFDTPEDACESYRRILLVHKKVPIIPWADRRKLVEHLWEVLSADREGLTINEMGSELIWFARTEGLTWPDRAIQKLLHTLNIARCFTDGQSPRYWQELFHTRLRQATSLEEALLAMHDVYARGIRLAEPKVPLDDLGMALLLYDKQAQEHIEEVRKLIERIAGRPTAARTVIAEAFERAREESK